ncbi:hypothetical protein Poli38472_012806 [Pythium oligandrum]|uniref:Uncharacterized protein n=1 Tax=Pythium oligandrum TaxID=41045 RepID=A0A8K1FKH0_PYTOL|nr:hypothetical protein Poli38472_012806 [Pythium oligandrum]|eukprot:TMW64184.1 hypothetical protein Poli38472_012806 [Pythium oligandrum]
MRNHWQQVLLLLLLFLSLFVAVSRAELDEDAENLEEVPDMTNTGEEQDDNHDESRQLLESEPTEEYDGPPGLDDLELIAFNIEFADTKVLSKLLDWAYDQAVVDAGRTDGFMRAEDLPHLLYHSLNPSNHDIDVEDYMLLSEASEALRTEQGLLDDDVIVHRGFIGRGSPLRFLRRLAHDMHHQHTTRRLQAQSDDADRDL